MFIMADWGMYLLLISGHFDYILKSLTVELINLVENSFKYFLISNISVIIRIVV